MTATPALSIQLVTNTWTEPAPQQVKATFFLWQISSTAFQVLDQSEVDISEGQIAD